MSASTLSDASRGMRVPDLRGLLECMWPPLRELLALAPNQMHHSRKGSYSKHIFRADEPHNNDTDPFAIATQRKPLTLNREHERSEAKTPNQSPSGAIHFTQAPSSYDL